MIVISVKACEAIRTASAKRGSNRQAIVSDVVQRAALLRASSQEHTFPAQLDAIARNAGVRAIRVVPLAMRGRLMLEEGTYVIEVSASLDAFEQQFVIAHELGHILVEISTLAECPDRSERARRGGASSYQLVERLCDVAAAELLLPSEFVRDSLRGTSPNINAVLDLARVSQLPIAFTVQRIIEAGFWVCRFVWWARGPHGISALRSVPSATPEFLASIALVPTANCAVIRAFEQESVVTGEVVIETWGSVESYRTECVCIQPGQVVSLLIYG